MDWVSTFTRDKTKTCTLQWYWHLMFIKKWTIASLFSSSLKRKKLRAAYFNMKYKYCHRCYVICLTYVTLTSWKISMTCFHQLSLGRGSGHAGSPAVLGSLTPFMQHLTRKRLQGWQLLGPQGTYLIRFLVSVDFQMLGLKVQIKSASFSLWCWVQKGNQNLNQWRL